MKRLVFLGMLTLVFTGCKTQIIYQANISAEHLSIEFAEKKIKRMLLEQPRKVPPEKVEILNDHIKITTSRRLITGGALPVFISLYYDTPYKLIIFERSKTPPVYININRGEYVVYRIFMDNVKDAKTFVDCFEYLKTKKASK